MTHIARGFLNGVLGLLLVGTFLFPYVGGAYTAYVVIVLSLLLIIWNFANPPLMSFDLGDWFFVGSWSLLAIVFMIDNRPGQTDYLLAANFALFALYPLLKTALSRFAGPNRSIYVANLALAGAWIAALMGVAEKLFFNYDRAAGFAANPIPSSSMALFLGFIALIGVFAVQGNRRFFYLLGPLAGIGIVLMSSSRGPLLAVPAMLLVALVMVPIKRLYTLGVVIALFVGAGALYLIRPAIYGRLAALPGIIRDLLTGQDIPWDVDASGSIRHSILDGSLIAFQNAPWFGYGWYLKTTVVAKYMPWDVGFGDPQHAHLHSDILNFGISAGVVGLVALVLVLLGPIVSALYAPRDQQFKGRLYTALILSVGFACTGAVNLMFGFEYTTNLYVILAAILVGYCRDVPSGKSVS